MKRLMLRRREHLPQAMVAFERALLGRIPDLRYQRSLPCGDGGLYASSAYALSVSSGTVYVGIEEQASSNSSADRVYRVKISASLRHPIMEDLLYERRFDLTQRMTSGVVFTTLHDVSVECQATLSAGDDDFVADLILAAASSIDALFTWCLGYAERDRPPKSGLRALSSWTTHDLAQLRYDFAHRPAQSERDGACEIRSYAGFIRVWPVAERAWHPAGLVITSHFAKHGIQHYGLSFVWQLNQVELETSSVPVLGEWTESGDSLVFTMFLPNAAKAIPRVTEHAVSWALQRLEQAPAMIERAMSVMLRSRRDPAMCELR